MVLAEVLLISRVICGFGTRQSFILTAHGSQCPSSLGLPKGHRGPVAVKGTDRKSETFPSLIIWFLRSMREATTAYQPGLTPALRAAA